MVAYGSVVEYGRFQEVGNVFPNEMAYGYTLGGVNWGVLLVFYTLYTGLVAGTYLVAFLSLGLNNARYHRVAGLSLILALSFILAAPLFPLAELRQPQRALSILTRPHLSPSETYPGVSPISLLAIVYPLLLVVTILLVVFAFRAEASRRAAETGRLWYKILSLGMGSSEASLRRDLRVAGILVSIGLILAVLFASYVGFLLVATKARVLWIDATIPIHFVASGILSGAALVAIAYYIVAKLASGRAVDNGTIRGLGWVMLWALLTGLGLDIVSESARAYHGFFPPGLETYGSEVLMPSLRVAYYAITAVILVLLLVSQLKTKPWLVLLASLLSMIQVAIYRWLAVIPAQLLSRTNAGVLHYSVEAHEARLVVGVVAATIFLATILAWILPWGSGHLARARHLGASQGGDA